MINDATRGRRPKPANISANIWWANGAGVPRPADRTRQETVFGQAFALVRQASTGQRERWRSHS
jgi:hypothetical protein